MAQYFTKIFLNGEFVNSKRGLTFSTFDPSTGELITEVQEATSVEVQEAIALGNALLAPKLNTATGQYEKGWGNDNDVEKRVEILKNLAKLIERDQQILAETDSRDMGKPLRESLIDIGDAITLTNHFIDLLQEFAKEGMSEVVDNKTDGEFTTTVKKEPCGIVGAITPWNFPFLMSAQKIIPAIATGNVLILKPSEYAPLSTLHFAALCKEAGIPNGALAVLPGYGAQNSAARSGNVSVNPIENLGAGAALAHPSSNLDKIFFTGSTATGKYIMKDSAEAMRPLSLELGGKSPLIICQDINEDDLTPIVDWILTGFVFNCGQVCSSTSRIIVHKNVAQALVSKLQTALKKIIIKSALGENEEGNTQDTPSIGPIVCKEQFERVKNFLKIAEEEKLQKVFPTSEHFISKIPENGFFVSPHVFFDLPESSRLWKEEIFGPVLSIMTFEDEQQGLHLMNNTEYGLAAAICSKDPVVAHRLSREVRAGIVWVNCSQPTFVQAPWGGYKRSGFGRDLGKWGFEEFLAVKQITGCAASTSWSFWPSPN